MEASTLRARARANLAGNWGVSIGVAAVAVLLGGRLTGNSFLPEISADYNIPILTEFVRWLDQGITFGNLTINIRSGVFGLAATIIGGVLQLGYARFLLKQHDGEAAEFNDLFSQFDRFGDGFAQRFLRILYTSLWSLLFIIPGIVKSYSYSMTPYIMIDHPELTASQAIEHSKELMDGHKMELFVLDLTFFGWTLLCGLTANLGYLVLNPYANAARAAFYRQLVMETIRNTIE